MSKNKSIHGQNNDVSEFFGSTESSAEIIRKIKEKQLINLKEYASHIKSIPFLTTHIDSIDTEKIILLRKYINRDLVIYTFAQILQDITSAILLEAGIYEYTLVTGTMRNHIDSILPNIYESKFDDILQNINENTDLNNHTLRKAIRNRTINAQQVAFMSPQDLHPDRWELLVQKHKRKEENKKNIAVTDLYQCRKCKERKCRMIELQTRSSDEPMTQFVTCLNCYHVMKY